MVVVWMEHTTLAWRGGQQTNSLSDLVDRRELYGICEIAIGTAA